MRSNPKKINGAEYFFSCMVILLMSFPPAVFSSETAETNPQISTRIIGGNISKDNAWPWMVAILDRNVSSNFFAQYCGGTIIHPQWILTSAHCLYDDGLFTPAHTIDVLVGTNDLENGGQRIHVDDVRIHSQFTPGSSTPDNDIALLHLTSSVENIKPLSLPGHSFDLPVVQPGSNSTVLGWGTTVFDDSGAFPAQLMQVDLPILTESDCKILFDQGEITSSHLCAGFLQGGRDSCVGDSGGPLISSIFGEDKLVGIVSWGRGCGFAGSPGVYTRVSKYKDFINEQMCIDDQPEAPTLSVIHTANSNGENDITLSFSEVNGADNYRLYYTDFKEETEDIKQISHIDLGRTNSFTLPSNIKFYVIGQAVKNNCASGYSNLTTVP